MRPFLKALLVSARLPVLPSVFSHGLMGILLSLPAGERGLGQASPLWLLVLVSCTFFYLAGMWGNDAKDALWDQKERPERPIPRGWVTAETLGLCALISGVLGGLLMPLWAGEQGGQSVRALWVSVFLLADIAAYTYTHKKWAGSAFFMGGARALLVFLTASVLSPLAWQDFEIVFYSYVGFLFCYVSFVTYLAQKETWIVGRKQWVGRLLSFMPLWDVVWLWVLGLGSWAWLPLLLWGISSGLRAFKWQTT